MEAEFLWSHAWSDPFFFGFIFVLLLKDLTSSSKFSASCVLTFQTTLDYKWNLMGFSLSFFFNLFLSFLWIGAQFPQEKFLSYGRILTLDYYFLLMCILFAFLFFFLPNYSFFISLSSSDKFFLESWFFIRNYYYITNYHRNLLRFTLYIRSSFSIF